MTTLPDQTSPTPMARVTSALNDARIRSAVLQTLTLLIVFGGLIWIVNNTITNMNARNMSAGFDFLDVSAGFGIGFTIIPYQEGDSYLRVFLVGISNTLLVAIVSIVMATVVGLFVGLARLSDNWIIGLVARSYIEIIRNTPLLLQIIAWYFGVFNLLPRPRDSVELGAGFVLNNRGFYLPAPVAEAGLGLFLFLCAAALAGAIGLYVWSNRRLEKTGQSFPAIRTGLALVIGVPALAFIVLSPLSWDMPTLQGFNFQGGMSVPPAFCALIVALSAYTSCFIAEIVRSGIQSVSKGQLEAAGALNLPANWTLRRVVMPQAMRVIIPPLISQYLNVTKNSSLAIAIGFPDLVSVWMNTSLNQSGRAIPIVAMTMAFYCTVSLGVSVVMNVYNKRVQLQER